MDTVRYSNCWEDAAVLLKAMNVRRGGRYLSVASAGDNTLSILTQNPSLVLAVDISPAQIACLELRVVVFKNLSYDRLLQFLGIHDSPDRVGTYLRVRGLLSGESRQFWDRNRKAIQQGIIHAGKVESYFRAFRKWILPFILNRRECKDLLKEKSRAERVDFYRRKVNSWRWRMFCRVFFGPAVMAHLDLGRKSQFYRSLNVDIADYAMKRTEHAMTALPTHDNPYLEYIIEGNYRKTLPFYLLRDNYDKIRGNLSKLKILRGSLAEVLQSNGTMRFDGFNLSDIFEQMNEAEYVKALELILGCSEKGARLVYWNNLVRRTPGPFLRDHLRSLAEVARDLFLENRAFFYSSLVVEEVQRPRVWGG